jgi:hypothetical protein
VLGVPAVSMAFPILGNDIDQTANAYNLNTYNESLIKTSKAKLKRLRLALLKHLLILLCSAFYNDTTMFVR